MQKRILMSTVEIAKIPNEIVRQKSVPGMGLLCPKGFTYLMRGPFDDYNRRLAMPSQLIRLVPRFLTKDRPVFGTADYYT